MCPPAAPDARANGSQENERLMRMNQHHLKLTCQGTPPGAAEPCCPESLDAPEPASMSMPGAAVEPAVVVAAEPVPRVAEAA